MNQGLHRLVFNRRLGLFVAVGECARTHGKTASNGRSGRAGRAAALAAALVGLLAPVATPAQTRAPVVFARSLPAPAHPLPQAYGTLRNTDGSFVNDPAARHFVQNPAHRPLVQWLPAADGLSATFKQGDVDRVILNWDRFDIGAGHRVHFEQNKDTSRYVSALNRIWSLDPSLILGSLTADREVILVNANGVYFGRGARVNTGKFVATANSIADAVFEQGLRNVTDGSAVFDTAGTDYLPTNRNAAISVESGAEIRSVGGDVLLIAPRVVNQGRIETPQGQSVLAAGDKVYLMSSSDPAQRGLIVAVDPIKLEGSTTENDPTLGIVENAATGSYKTVDGATVDESTPSSTAGLVQKINEIRAESGTVNLVGLLVRQAGQINATTAVKGANGAVYLQGMASTQSLAGGTSSAAPTSLRGLVVEDGARARVAASGGTVEIAAGSSTHLMPAADGATQIAAEVFNPSRLRVEAETITVGTGASLLAPAGRIELLAASTRQLSPLLNAAAGFAIAPDDSRVVVSPGATLSVAGLRDVAVDGARNQASQRLFRIELADAPVQRDGPLYRQEVFFDGRDSSRITAANVSGATAGNRFTAAEKSTAGGTLRIEAEGSVVLGSGARLDVSGGSVNYSATTLETSLLTRDGVVVLFRNASAGSRYDTLLEQTRKTPVPAYVEGRDGGELLVAGRRLAFDGTPVGQVVQGERQRDGSATPARPAALTAGRNLGNAQYLGGLSLQAGVPEPIDPAIFAAPATAELTGLPAVTPLSLQQVAEGGFGTLRLRAAQVSQPSFGILDLGLGGQLDILSKQIALDGAFTLPGGTVALFTDEAGPESATTGLGDIRLSAATRLDTAGLWTNDSVSGGASGLSPLQLNGGRVSIGAAHDLLIEPGADIDVSGGARLSGSGAVSRGRAGSVTLAAGRSDLFETRLAIDGVRLAGYDFGAGGSLSINAPNLLLAEADATAPEGFAGLRLAPDFFSSGGFGSVSVNAFGDLRLPAGTALAPTLQSWLLSPDHRRAASGRMRADVALPAPVDESLADRLPVNLSLSATRTLNPALAGATGGRLVVERGASITLEAAGTLALSATGRVDIGTEGGTAGDLARLDAPGGTIRIGLTGVRGANSLPEAGTDPNGFIAGQSTWIGADAELSVAGTAELRIDRSAPAFSTFGSPAAGLGADRITGHVLGGGTIELVNQRGYVVLEQGSQLTLDGAAAELNVRGQADKATVARAPGSLVLGSPEGLVLDGTIRAQVPRGATGRALTTGGNLQLSQGVGGVSTFTAGTAYPTAQRELLIGEFGPTLASASLRPGDDLFAAIGNGRTRLPLSLLRSAGFDSLRLGAGDRIAFETPTTLSAAVAITLDSPVLAAAPGTAVELSARTVSIGDRTLSRTAPAASTAAIGDTAAADRATTLWLRGQTVEAVGKSALQGFSSVHLDAGVSAAGEVRFSAVSPTEQLRQVAGSAQDFLGFAGELTITAGQAFATTTADFTVRGLPATGSDDPGSRIALRTASGGAAAQPPLSAFGQLTLDATEIDHQGVLRQPFGGITLTAARSLTLGDGSVTSVSGAGQTLLYGGTDNLTQWLQPLFNDYRSVLPRDKAIRLEAALIATAPGARVDAAGGGTIVASEFFAGVGGSTDYFDTSGLFAVLPDYAAQAPVSLTGNLAEVDSPGRELVVTTPGSGLAPGSYTLLPARFALLSDALPRGAFLVRRASDQGSVLLGAPLVQDDGSVVVSGRIRAAGAVEAPVPGERFVIESPEVFRQRSEVRLTDVGELLTRRAAVSDAAAPALPVDGGAIRVAASGSERSLWQAQFKAGAAGGKAGTLDISANRLALVDNLDKTPASTLGVSAGSLSGSGAGSVLIGGVRSAAPARADGTPTVAIDAAGTSAVTVDLAPGQPLVLEELILASSGTLDLAAGTRLAATAAGTLGERALTLAGDGALAFVSANALAADRSARAGAAGVLDVGADSLLSGAHVGLDATAQLSLADSARFTAGALSLTAPGIAIGTAAEPIGTATTLQGALLASVRGTADLSLRSYTRIDFSGTQLWAERVTPDGDATRVLDRLVLDAPQLRGLDGPAAGGAAAEAARTDIAAREIVLRNSLTGDAPLLAAGSGTLLLEALPPVQYGRTGGLTLGPGAAALAFGDVTLRSRGDIVLDGTGGVSAQGDLRLDAARLTATNAASHALKADAGWLRIGTVAAGRTLGERVGQGATLSLSAQRIVQEGRIELPAGLLDLSATGGGDGGTAGAAALRFGAASVSSVAGFSVAGPDGFVVDGPAGRIRATAGTGSIELLGRLDASAALRADGSRGEGDAGSIELRAAGAGGALLVQSGADRGSLQAHGGSRSQDRGGSLAVDVRNLGDSAALLTAAGAGGIDHELRLRSREGDIAIAGTVTAERVRIAADGGSLRLDGATVDARAAGGGLVQLSAGNNLTLGEGARIDARSTAGDAPGGDVLLAAANGRVALAAGATVDAGGDAPADGRIVLRALRSADGSTLQVDPLLPANLKAGEVNLEAVRVYRQVSVGGTARDITGIVAGSTPTSGSAGNLGQASVNADSTAFMASAAGALDGLGIGEADRSRFHLRAGVEVQAAGALTLSADWALNSARPGGDAGFLTLRAAGNLALNGSLSDGFASALATAALTDSPRAWSYRLVAGADLTGADPLAVAASTDTGTLSVAGGKLVRTGAGSIEIAAAQDLRLLAATGTATTDGMVYVAGTRRTGDDADAANALFARQAARPTFSERGGRLAVEVGRDVVAPEARQLVNNWLWRSGTLRTTAPDVGLYSQTSHLGWWTEFSRFRQSLGAFGGASIRVRAGRDAINLQAMAPDAGWADSRDPTSATLRTIGGGEVDVLVGGDVLAGQFLAGRGTGRITALGAVDRNRGNVEVDEIILASLGGASWQVQARASVAVANHFNPTAVPVSATDNRLNLSSYFYTWGETSTLSLRSAAGNVEYTGSNVGQPARFGLVSSAVSGDYFSVMPSSLDVLALGGNADLFIGSGGVMFPSANGQLRVWADANVRLGGASNNAPVLAMSDSAVSDWPDFSRPPTERGGNSVLANAGGLIRRTLDGSASGAALHATDAEPVRVHADDSIAQNSTGTWRLPKAARFSAANDVINLRIETQHPTATGNDETAVTAGRNFTAGLAGLVEVAGPGSLDVHAGREVNLGSSPGLRTIGNQANPNLSPKGASIRLAAATAATLDLSVFEAGYLSDTGASANPRSASHRDLLRDSVRAALADPSLDYAQAWAQFQRFPAEAQAALAQQVLAAEFGAVYLEGPAPTTDSVTTALNRGFDRRKADIIAAGEAALAAGGGLELPGRDELAGAELASFLNAMRGLGFSGLDIDGTVTRRVTSLQAVRTGWRDSVATSLGSTAAALDALAAAAPDAPAAVAWRNALAARSGPVFERYQEQVLERETRDSAAAASDFGRLSLPMRLALFDEGFRAAELSGAGSFVPQPVWPGAGPVLRHGGELEMTQSAVITERGGDISLVNPGGGINVGLKVGGNSADPKGVIALGGGDVFGYARDDFQVNTQRVFIVGKGNMAIWSSIGDIDSGRGANTAVGAPPLAPRRSVDGVVFEIPATTTGSGLGIVPDVRGVVEGNIGLYPAFGEILALDAFIRAPSITLGATVKGADNLGGGSVIGAVVALAVSTAPAAPPPSNNEQRTNTTTSTGGGEAARERNSLLTVELLGIGPGEPCEGLSGTALVECRRRLAVEPPRERP